MDSFVPKTAAATAASPKLPRASRLDSLQRVRQEAARLYWCGRRHEIAPADASRLASVLALVASLLRDVELEQRVQALEEASPYEEAAGEPG
jgi:hypothetical protein